MSDTLDLTTLSDEPVESNVQVEITDADPDTEEPVPDAEEPVEEPEETPEETPEEPVEEAPEETPETPEEPVEEEPVEEEPVEEEAPAEVPEEEAPTEAPVEEEAPAAPVEQVATDIRNILTEVPTVSEGNEESVDNVESVETTGLSDDLKQRIAELDYLRECCGNWANYGDRSLKMFNENLVDKFMKEFIDKWKNKDITIN